MERSRTLLTLVKSRSVWAWACNKQESRTWQPPCPCICFSMVKWTLSNQGQTWAFFQVIDNNKLYLWSPCYVWGFATCFAPMISWFHLVLVITPYVSDWKTNVPCTWGICQGHIPRIIRFWILVSLTPKHSYPLPWVLGFSEPGLFHITQELLRKYIHFLLSYWDSKEETGPLSSFT